MTVPWDIQRGYDQLKAGLVGDAQAHFEKFLAEYDEEDDLRARALTGLAMIRRRAQDHRGMLDLAVLSVKASGPTLNLSWNYIQEGAKALYSDEELHHGTCQICRSDLVCPPDIEPNELCCPHHEGRRITWE
jgi:hypothetical protein